MSDRLKLPASALKLNVNLAWLDFAESSGPADSILGQQRAQTALEFGIAMPNSGYNIFVMGKPGWGRLSMIMNHLEKIAPFSPSPPAFAYVNNFDNPREPLVLELPAGHGQCFYRDIEKLIDYVSAAFPATFESPAYQQKKNTLERQFQQAYNAAIDQVEKKAQELDVALYRDGETVSFAPIVGGKSLSEQDFMRLPQAERESFHRHVEELEDSMSEALLELPQWRRKLIEKIRRLDVDTIEAALEPFLAELYESYRDIGDVRHYLSELRQHLTAAVASYSSSGKANDAGERRLLLTESYAPNILVDPKKENGAPVIYEPHPIYPNLFGRIEYVSEQGTLVTSYRKICAGSLHKANGGYLILDAEKILAYPFVWEALKRALQSGRIEIESPYSELGVNTITLKPQVTPLDIKVILVGTSSIYYLLEELDSEFGEMFKILSDFDDQILLGEVTARQFALSMRQHAKAGGAETLTPDAIGCLIEHSCRLAESQYHLSARIRDSFDIINEANLFRQKSGQPSCGKMHIELALAARESRNGRISMNMLEDMLDGTVLIDTSGAAIGKINGLTILEIGGSSFGAPARITTTVSSGSRGIVDIEREAELGQSIHSKGVLILTGYLGHFYAQQFPLAISASIAIEQSYSYIDGDSASLAEVCCLISALTRTPIRQSFAVTGSINQYGEVQAIGGVNEKIEGFFRLCRARGLDGSHAVIIPAANKRNLMLKHEVIEAVAQGLFLIYAVTKVNEALELLTGQPAGDPDEAGRYPEGSVNFKAISRLKEISELANDDDKETAA